MSVEIIQGDCLEVLRTLPAESVHCCVTSPPYWGLRDYGCDAQIGLEATPVEFIAKMVEVFDSVRRVLRSDGTVWLNLGDTYSQGNKGNSGELSLSGKQATNKGSHSVRRGDSLAPNRTGGANGYCKPKNLVGIPCAVAFALRDAGWYLRQDIIWHKPNPMPESVRDRCTKSHEYIFLLSKNERYYFNQDAIKEPTTQSSIERLGQDIGGDHDNPFGITRNKRSVWTIEDHESLIRWLSVVHPNVAAEYLVPMKPDVWTVTTKPYKAAHFATFPPDLIQPCILAGCPEGGTVLDPFLGSGTTALVAQNNGCNCIGIELNPEYVKLAKRRVSQRSLL